MKINPKIVKNLLDIGEPIQRAVNRRVGNTTQAILRAIADSYDNFGIPIIVQEKHEHGSILTDKQSNCLFLLYETQKIIHKLEFSKTIQAKTIGTNVYIINTFAEEVKNELKYTESKSKIDCRT